MTRSRNALPVATLAGLLVTTSSLFADGGEAKTSFKDIDPGLRQPLVETVSAHYSYVGGSDLKSNGNGNLSEQTADFNYELRVPVNDTVGVGFGLKYNRIDFGVPENSFLPDSLETVNIGLLGYYKLSNDWSLFAMFGPRMNLVNGWDDIGSNNITWSGGFGAQHEFNKDLSLQFGLGVNPGTDNLPILPLLGLRWHFADQWTLNVGFPRTAIDYQVLPNLQLSLETSFFGGTYQTGSTYGSDTGHPELNNRSLRYNEVRVGLGATYTVVKNVDLELSTGAVVYREFDFKDTDYDPTVKPAPYVQGGIRVKF